MWISNEQLTGTPLRTKVVHEALTTRTIDGIVQDIIFSASDHAQFKE